IHDPTNFPAQLAGGVAEAMPIEAITSPTTINRKRTNLHMSHPPLWVRSRNSHAVFVRFVSVTKTKVLSIPEPPSETLQSRDVCFRTPLSPAREGMSDRARFGRQLNVPPNP